MYFPEVGLFKKMIKKGNIIPVYREILADQKSCVDEDKMDAKRQGER